MDEAVLDARVNELITETTRIFLEKYESLKKSGALDLEKYDDNYVLPKVIMCALCQEAYEQWQPPQMVPDSKKLKREAKNLYRCM